MKVFSLSTVNVIITNKNFGQITIGGAGKLLGNVRYGYANEMFKMRQGRPFLCWNVSSMLPILPRWRNRQSSASTWQNRI